jgi:LDH2 family malate/lactate/ureidoglycolate dehydrogenase
VTQARFPAGALIAAAGAALVAEGVPEAIARIEATLMVDADLCGVPSHGIVTLPKLLAGLREGRAARDTVLRLVRDDRAACVLDGGNGPGRYVAAAAMDHAIARARGHGSGICLATNTTHWGRAHAYAAQAARAGMIGLCTTNAIPTMAVAGVTRPVLGNNPLAIAVPRRDREEPVVLDIAMTQAAFGKVATCRREGRPVPGTWGLDAGGRATEDPSAILASGLLLPMGGHKGIGLAVMMELLTAALSGGLFSHEIVRRDATGLDPFASKLFVAIDVAAFGDRARFDSRVDDLLAYLRGIDPDHPVLAPGERGFTARREYERDGVPIHPDIIGQLNAAGVVLPGWRVAP